LKTVLIECVTVFLLNWVLICLARMQPDQRSQAARTGPAIPE